MKSFLSWFFFFLSTTKCINRLFQINTELKGMAPENALPLSALLSKIAKILAIIPLMSVLLSIPTLLAQKPVGIYAGYVPPGRK